MGVVIGNMIEPFVNREFHMLKLASLGLHVLWSLLRIPMKLGISTGQDKSST